MHGAGRHPPNDVSAPGGLCAAPRTPYGPPMQNGAISDQARMLAAVSELDASPAPATSVAGEMLVAVVGALVPSDLSKVWLGDDRPFFDARHKIEGRRIADEPLGSASVRHHEHLEVTIHDSTGLLTTGRGRRSAASDRRGRRSSITTMTRCSCSRRPPGPSGSRSGSRTCSVRRSASRTSAPIWRATGPAAASRTGTSGRWASSDRSRRASCVAPSSAASRRHRRTPGIWRRARPRCSRSLAWASRCPRSRRSSGSRWGRSVPIWARPTRRQQCDPVPLPRPRSWM